MRESSFNENGGLSFIDNGVSIPSLQDSKRKAYLHFPSLSCQEKTPKFFSKYMHSDFSPVFNIASLLGITFSTPSSDIEDCSEVRTNAMKKAYDIIVNLVCFTSLVITLSFSHNFAASKAMALTYLIKFASAFIIRCNLIAGSCKIPQVITTLSQLYSELSSSIYKSLKVKIYIQCLTLVVIDVTLLSITTARIFNEAELDKLHAITIFGHNLTDSSDALVMQALVVAHLLNYFFSIFTVSLCLIASCNVHVILRRLVKSYASILIESIKNKSNDEGFSEDFVKFRRIMYGVSEADNALSFIACFIYVTCISCFFYTLSSFMAIHDFFSRPYFAAETCIVFMFSLIIFGSFTYSAVLVSSAGENLKHRVVCASEIVLKKKLSSETLLNFMILFDNIKCSNTALTGWGMFTITRGFFLSTVGVMITYGVLLFQFGS